MWKPSLGLEVLVVGQRGKVYHSKVKMRTARLVLSGSNKRYGKVEMKGECWECEAIGRQKWMVGNEIARARSVKKTRNIEMGDRAYRSLF